MPEMNIGNPDNSSLALEMGGEPGGGSPAGPAVEVTSDADADLELEAG